MKKILLGIMGLAFLTANAQTADEVIGKYAAAMGGLDAFNKVQTVKMSGTVAIQGTELPITIYIINGKAMRSDIEFSGQFITNVYKDGTGWKTNPFMGITTPTDVTGAELNEFKTQAMVANQLMDYKARGHQVELQGEEEVSGVKTSKIKMTNKEDGKVTTYFISTVDNSLVKSVTTREMMGSEVEIETYYSDMKDINGLKFSTARSQKVEGQEFQSIKLDTVEVNVPVDEKIFNK
jgi:hypothetical protein